MAKTATYSIICWNLKKNRFEIPDAGQGLGEDRARLYAGAIKREKLAVICLASEANAVLIERILGGFHAYKHEQNLVEPPLVSPGMKTRGLPAKPVAKKEASAYEQFIAELVPTPDLLARKVAIIGSTPLPQSLLKDVLRDVGITEVELDCDDAATLIIGETEWDGPELDRFLEARRGRQLCVYSQQLFLFYLMVGKDPHDTPEALGLLSVNHPALEFLSMNGFDWVHTDVVPSRWGAENGHPETWPSVSPLKLLGYTVGAKGLPPSQRREILRRAFEESLPKAHSPEYMEKWGVPKSAKRLEQIAVDIACFVQNRKRQKSPSGDAILHWESDLLWLNKAYYHGRFLFSWPSTQVRS